MDNMFDAIFKSMQCVGVLVTDGKGIITEVGEEFNEFYKKNPQELIGKSVYDLERAGVFNPSAAVQVIKERKEVTILQKLNNTQEVIVTAIPIVEENGEISKIVTFSRDMKAFNQAKDMYEDMNKRLKELYYEESIIDGLNTNNQELKEIYKSIKRVAKYDINILIEGETGTGKSFIAKKIHKESYSNYSKGPFIEINCGAIPESLIESELFGYEGGTFTGAEKKGKIGLFESAEGGTLFLDEISEMPLMSQVKLLKVIQDKEFRRVGGRDSIKINCRIISASNKDLNVEVSEGRFRQDLLYRLNAISYVLPPLRERSEDIISISKEILERANSKYDIEKTFDSKTLNMFAKYCWPGNIRELENIIYKLAITTEGDRIEKEDLPRNILDYSNNKSEMKKTGNYEKVDDLNQAIEKFEGEIIRAAFEEYNSSIKLGKALNISQTTAARKIKKYVLQKNESM